MKIYFLIFIFLLSLIVTNCSKKDISSNDYEVAILSTTLSKSIPQLQTNYELELLKKHQIKYLSMVMQRKDSLGLDSITFIEFDKEGKIIRRTTTENTSAGCLPYWHRQEFFYADNKIQRVNNYTFKYKTKSILEKWLTTDTTQLVKFDWEDYTYSKDTIKVESGFATYKFIIDADGKIIKQTVATKTNNQTFEFDYDYSNLSVNKKLVNSIDGETDFINYVVEGNRVLENHSDGTNAFSEELIFDSTGFIRSRIRYKNGEKLSETFYNYIKY